MTRIAPGTGDNSTRRSQQVQNRPGPRRRATRTILCLGSGLVDNRRMRTAALMLAVVAAAGLAGCSSSGHGATSTPTRPAASLTVRAPTWGQPASRCQDDQHLGTSPAISWATGPAGTSSYAVTILDPDAHEFVHWAVLDIPATVTSLAAGISPGGSLPAGAHELDNGFGKPGYGGPCPPPGSIHHYVLTVWAVRDHPAAIADLGRDAVAAGSVTVTYSR
jgi:Raf kinase inhibitor-like YbhB/YbcL family protein